MDKFGKFMYLVALVVSLLILGALVFKGELPAHTMEVFLAAVATAMAVGLFRS